jgi:serine/threonine-protein kinase RsbW
MAARLRVPAELSSLAPLRHFARDTARALGAHGKTLDDLELAVDEAVTNIIEHGYAGRSGEIEIEVRRTVEGCLVCLRDQAPPFDPTQLPEPDVTLPLAQRPVGGLGMFLVRRLMDAVRYQRTTQGYNELILVKRLDHHNPTSEEALHADDH